MKRLVGLAFLAPWLVGCDHPCSVEGTVYEAPVGISGVFLTTKGAKVEGMTRLEGVKVDIANGKNAFHTTDSKGMFDEGWISGGDPKEIQITVSKPGYKTVVAYVPNRSECVVFLKHVAKK